jgi:hypothetical protein
VPLEKTLDIARRETNGDAGRVVFCVTAVASFTYQFSCGHNKSKPPSARHSAAPDPGNIGKDQMPNEELFF